MMKRVLLIGIALAFIWTGCIQDEAALIPDQQEAQRLQPKDSVWVVSIRAEKAIPGPAGNEGMTKGLAIGAGVSEDSTTVLQSIWKADEPVEVYLKGAHIGTLKATPDPTDAHQATLSGTVTTTGITAGTTLTLLTPPGRIGITRGRLAGFCCRMISTIRGKTTGPSKRNTITQWLKMSW